MSGFRKRLLVAIPDAYCKCLCCKFGLIYRKKFGARSTKRNRTVIRGKIRATEKRETVAILKEFQ